jgi:HSP20 family molecular chaperone IbpA
MWKRIIVNGTAIGTLALSTAIAAPNDNSKTDQKQPATPPSATTGKPSNVNDWNERFFKEMRNLQDRMDQLFSDAWNETGPEIGQGFQPGFASSVKLSDEGGNYIVRLSLPERDAKNVEAHVDSGNVLRIVANEEHNLGPNTTAKPSANQPSKNPPAENTPSNKVTPGNTPIAPERGLEMSRYEQLITLPGSVDASKMKVDRQGTTVTITLPKA